jgi:hypothetical protein
LLVPGASIWIFMGARAQFPSGVFEERGAAEAWIRRNRLTGTLTMYPVNVGTYDWAVAAGLFSPKKDSQREPEFIGRFSTASQEHFHYEAGIEAGAAEG